jgi:hypothetical protein
VTSRLSIFVSAGPDLEIEREVVGKAIAALPVSVGWVIKYTPLPGEVPDPSMEPVATRGFAPHEPLSVGRINPAFLSSILSKCIDQNDSGNS